MRIETMPSRWWTLVLRGAVALVLGVICLALPKAAFFALVLTFGVYAIVDGFLTIALATRLPGAARWPVFARGLVGIVAGAFALAMPGITGLALLLLIASWAVAAGIFEIVMAIRHRDELRDEWLLVVEGALSIGFGVLLFVSPAIGAIALGVWIGMFALVIGLVYLGAGFRLRSWHKADERDRIERPPPPRYREPERELVVH
jgi:uncharacterized membrane protein HdeD (DUF308 family)